jgi:hypothetical protein
MSTAPLFTTIRTEGGLLPADVLGRVAALDNTLGEISPESYYLLPGERIREAVTRSWQRLEGAWAVFRQVDPAVDEGASRRWLLGLFAELGYGRLQPAGPTEIDGRNYPLTHRWAHVPIHLLPARASLDHRSPGVAGAARQSPHAMVQELLNRSEADLWALVSNGLQLRLLRDNSSLTRQAYVEWDLEAIFGGGQYADFAVLWLVCHQSRLEGEPPQKCILEAWTAEAARTGTRALEHLRDSVQTAINELGSGFLAHPDNHELRRRLAERQLSSQDYYRQLLRLVYRLLFLLVAEARDALHPPGSAPVAIDRYRSWYSVARLAAMSETTRGGPHADLWCQLRVVRAALGSDDGQPALALPGLGSMLWSPHATADLDQSSLANAALLAAVRALTWRSDAKEHVVRSVDYRNLGSEELGSVYESLLELHPNLDSATGEFSLDTAAGNERKTTGSYYTPSSLISELLDSALEPVLDDRLRAAGPDPAAREAALLSVTVLDPACGSGHFLIAAAQRIARRLATVRSGDEEASPAAARAGLRDVVNHCLYGIDANEMAVELCKVSLWMEAIEPGKPLSFLDSRIVHGNALLGATPRLLARGVPDEAFKPLTGDDKATVRALRKTNRRERTARLAGQGRLSVGPSVSDLAAPVRRELAEIDALPETTPAEVALKERRFTAFQHNQATERACLAADAWCAAFVITRIPGAPVVTDATVQQLAVAGSPEPGLAVALSRLKTRYRFLHPHLAFPGIFLVPDNLDPDEAGPGWEGGFDVVVGNPPWEKVKLSEKEFFAARAPEITALAGAKRKAAIAELERDNPDLWDDLQSGLRNADCESHLLRQSGRYPLCGVGDINTYSVFAEHMRSVLATTGRLGVIVPTGIATDDTTKAFFSDCVSTSTLVSLFSFENEEFIFVGVHHSFKFCLLTLAGRPVSAASYFFFARSTADLTDPERRFLLTAKDLTLINPNTRTAPVFRSSRDAELTKRVYGRCPVLVRDSDVNGNTWGVEFSTMFHMTNDSNFFQSAAELEAVGAKLGGNIWTNGSVRWHSLYEAKMAHHFNHRWGDYSMKEINDGGSALPEIPDTFLADPTYVVQPRYWVEEEVLVSRLHGAQSLVGWRKITNTTNERTLIPFKLPFSGAGDNVIFMSLPTIESSLLVTACLSSFACDYLARQKLGGTNFQLHVIKQLAIIDPNRMDFAPDWDKRTPLSHWILSRAEELIYTSWDIAKVRETVGTVERPFQWNVKRREGLRAELDAAYFHLYFFGRDDAAYVMDTFPVVRKHDEKKYGEYRTRRLILERYDALAEAIAAKKPYQTVLDPPPADPSCSHPESTRPAWATRATT